IILVFKFLRSESILNDYVTAAWVTAIIVLLVGLISVLYTKETYGKELNFVEE
ncbi:MAG: MFS transporter, partial [Deinococcales bacterium]|nr:MFS transporter [Chitinophagaceae bacterium]